MTTDLRPGLLVLHGNRAEWLARTVFDWIASAPLAPLEEEIFLVQSFGMAEWLKTQLAAHSGICAAARVELPGRFLWRSYRQVLGPDAVPAQSPLDKAPLTWRLMQALPGLAAQPGFEPLAGFLGAAGQADMGRRLQLAQRLADLFDQYQVHRGDWLAAWAAGHDVLPAAEGVRQATDLPDAQRWQAALWRALLAPLPEHEREAARGQLHGRFVAALGAAHAVASLRPPVARRVVLFGMTHVPAQTLHALNALARHSQVLLAVPNPCRYHWADIMDGREALRAPRRRHAWRKGLDLSAVPLHDMHAHAHPLLAAWGQQGRDFVRQLDAFDDTVAARQHINVPRVDLFDDGPGATLLQQVQARVRDLVPLAEHAALNESPGADDRSIVFHVAHSAQREVEVLHDQLLALLACPPGDGAVSPPPGGSALNPRDVVVMVPDIEVFAPAIRSVFGQYAHGDARHIPFGIADLHERGASPLLVAVEWLLRMPQQRCTLSELRDLLDVPALAARLDLPPAQVQRLAQWMAGAGARWGLHLAQRELLGLGAAGDANTWRFALRRMLLGYASGDAGDAHFGGVEPYGEVGGLDAACVGALAALLGTLDDWLAQGQGVATPVQWGARLRQLTSDLFAPTDEPERLGVAAVHAALAQWLQACESACYEEAVTLDVAREAILAGLVQPGQGHRFRAGGVTFCTLMPMRAIPFEVVCLLGMNDGDYPRAAPRSDFDLMGLPGQARPGDRSRRSDDRQLMLEALLSARRVLYLSWAGKSVRDNTPQPPSVLVSQLRDYLAGAWGQAVVDARTTGHPLQPFSRRYFEHASAAGGGLFSFASEWRAAHETVAQGAAPAPAAPAFVQDPSMPLTVATLARFLKNPVKEFFRARLHASLADDTAAVGDDEVFGLDALEEWGLQGEVLATVIEGLHDGEAAATPPQLHARVQQQVARLRRGGRLPLGQAGALAEQTLVDVLCPMLERWGQLRAQAPSDVAPQALRFEHDGVVLVNAQGGLRGGGVSDGSAPLPLWLQVLPTRLGTRSGKRKPRPEKLIATWVRTLVFSACAAPVQCVLVGRDAVLTCQPPPADEAAAALSVLMAAWREGMQAPLPLPSLTAIAQVQPGRDVAGVYEGDKYRRGEVEEPCLARMFPDYEALCADGRFADLAARLFAPMLGWVEGAVQARWLEPPAGDLDDAAGDDD